MPPSCALLGGFAISARVALLWQHNANPSYKLASIPRYDDIVRTLGRVCARCWPVTGGWRGAHSQNCTPYMGSRRVWLASDWPSMGGILNITVAAWTVGFQWWRSGDITQTQNVSEYMLVLVLCLVRCIYGQEMKLAWLQGEVVSSGRHSASSRTIWVWISVMIACRSSGRSNISVS